jgi:2-polyprenyl-6-methoxyphenol hydroxylase-like FAD-dependent oxidoreductase
MLDVLICGAGPVGSFFANLMDQFGHTYRIIDSDTLEGRLGQSRALLLTARSLEIMEDRGIAREILSHALLSRGLRLHSDTKQVCLSATWFGHDDKEQIKKLIDPYSLY